MPLSPLFLAHFLVPPRERYPQCGLNPFPPPAASNPGTSPPLLPQSGWCARIVHPRTNFARLPKRLSGQIAGLEGRGLVHGPLPFPDRPIAPPQAGKGSWFQGHKGPAQPTKTSLNRMKKDPPLFPANLGPDRQPHIVLYQEMDIEPGDAEGNSGRKTPCQRRPPSPSVSGK